MDQYMMGIALAVRARANCLGSRVGAVIAVDRRIVSTGYNGTPAGMPNCDQGGCDRCADRTRFPAGTGYDVCICVHAEQNALLAAARFGIAVAGALIYTTSRPCFGCLKELLQAGVSGVRFLHEWTPRDPALKEEYDRLLAEFASGVQSVEIDDPGRDWAISSLRTADVQGHASSGS
jgi:dCMP deaminase